MTQANGQLREARLIVPLFDNHGRSLISLLRNVEARLTSNFGGVTVLRQVFGAWQDPQGKLYQEPVYVFDVAAPDNITSSIALRGIAKFAATEGGQLAVYLRHPSGTVEFVRPFAVPNPSAVA